MRKKAAGILKTVWTIVISVALISAGLMCLNLQKQVEELSRLPKNVLVYDRSRKEIVEYYGTPERIGNSLVLHDANILNIEDVSHLVEYEASMGRKERRAKERQERKESIRMTPDRIYELKQKTANEAVRRVQEIEKGKEKQRAETALDMLLLFGMTYLHEQKGWGKQRLENYYDGCMNLLKEFEDGKHTIKSLRDKLVEETKINLVEVQN